MRVVHIAHPDANLAVLEFHPKLTVIHGLAADDQLQLVTALRALLTAQPIDLLTSIAIGETELNVPGIAPLPPGAEDAIPVLDDSKFLTPVIKTDEAARRTMLSDAEAAEEARIETSLLRGEISDELEAARSRLDGSATRSLADVACAVAELEAQLAAKPGQASLRIAERAADRRYDLVALAASLSARSEWLGAEGAEVVGEAIAAVSDAIIAEPTLSLVAERLADQWSRANARFQTAQGCLEAEFGSLEQLERRLRSSHERHEAVSSENVARPKISPEDVVELEVAHDRVVEAEARVTGRASIYRPELIFARRAEQQILDRLGFATWSSFMLGGAFASDGDSADREVEIARREFENMKQMFDQLTDKIGSDLGLSAATEELEGISSRAMEILGETDDVEMALRSHLIVPEEISEQLPEAVSYLQEVLSALGFDDLSTLSPPELVAVASEWLTAAQSQSDDLVDLDSAHRACEAEVARLEPVLALAAAGEEPLDDARIDLMLSILEASEASFDRHVHAIYDFSIAAERMAIIELQLARFVVAAREKREEYDAAELPSEWVAVDAPQAAQVVRDHYDNLRSATSDALPAVFDAPLSVLDIAAQTAVLVEFSSLSAGVQTIWFTADRFVVDWAGSLGNDASVVTFVSAD
jgi:hypothetical protein